MNQPKVKYSLSNWDLVTVNPNYKTWNWKDLFCFWGVNVQSIIGFSLIASLYTIYSLNTLIVFFGTILGSLLVYFFSNLIGKPSQKFGLPFAVLLRTSMGFKGDNFLNACIEVRSSLSAELLLSKLLLIEERSGRKRYLDGQYHSRTLDLDILFFEQEIIENELLSVPHPRLESRLFVLRPLADIAPDFIHPNSKITMLKLLDVCNDISQISKQKNKLKIFL